MARLWANSFSKCGFMLAPALPVMNSQYSVRTLFETEPKGERVQQHAVDVAAGPGLNQHIGIQADDHAGFLLAR